MRRATLTYWADETAPDLTDILAPHGIDPAPFTEWLGEHLGDYRGSEAACKSMPAREDELQYLRTLHKSIEQTLAAMRTGDMPPRADQYTTLAALDLGVEWSNLRKRLLNDLTMARELVSVAQRKIEARTESPGRKSKGARRDLLDALVKELRRTPMKSDVARKVAADILTRCHIDVPPVKDATDTRAIRRAQRPVKGQK